MWTSSRPRCSGYQWKPTGPGDDSWNGQNYYLRGYPYAGLECTIPALVKLKSAASRARR